jgi:hypothetical protein
LDHTGRRPGHSLNELDYLRYHFLSTYF